MTGEEASAAPRALVTGGTRGIGLAITRRLASSGIKVWTCGVQLDETPEGLRELVQSGKVDYLRCDLMTQAGTEALIAHVPDNIGILVNNAGMGTAATLEATTMALWDGMLALHATAPMRLMQHFVPHMVRTGWGRVINISSISGKIGRSGRVAYAASKHTLIGLTRAAAHEFGATGVTVNCICPGATDTDMLAGIARKRPEFVDAIRASMPLGRLVQPTEIAALVSYLVQPGAAPVTGQSLVIDGGVVQS